MLRVAVLASGRGSNLAALIGACRDGRLNARIVGVFSDQPECRALTVAANAGVPTWADRPARYQSRRHFDAAMFDAIEEAAPGLVVCAGYMRIIGTAAIARFPGRMINIHPSLLPRHRGLDTHARALAAGDREHGASVHVVTAELDAGPVLTQARLLIEAGDDPQTLAARVLAREHPLLLATVAALASNDLELGALPRWRGAILSAPLHLSESLTLEATT